MADFRLVKKTLGVVAARMIIMSGIVRKQLDAVPLPSSIA